jgi:bacterioferritin-associated ferredoxin
MIGCEQEAKCGGCQMYSGPMVCHCMEVTEDQLISALVTLELRTVKDVRRHIGAGTGCNSCHRRIQTCLDNYASSSSPEICSVR